MSDDRATHILDDFNAFPELDNWRSFVDNIWIYLEERKSGIIGGRTAGQIDNTRIFDTTPRESLEIFSAGIVSDLTPQGEPWLELVPQSFTPSEEEVDFYNKASERVRTRIGQSNFYRAFHEGVHSGGGSGVFCLCVMPGKRKPFNFTEIQYGNFRFREDSEGVPDIVFHEWEEKTVDQIKGFFQEELDKGTASLSEKMLEVLASDNAEFRNTKFKVVHRVMRRTSGVVEGVTIPSQRPYESVYVVQEEKHTILDDDGFYYQPYIVVRMLKSRHDANQGRSPGTQIYPITRMLNRAVRDMGVAIELTVRPAILEPADSAFQIDNRPNGRIPFDPHVPNSKPEVFNQVPNLPLADWFINRLTNQIRSAFFVDMFKLFTDREIATTQKTAFEAQLQAEEQLRLFTPIFLNIVDEGLNRYTHNIFTEMFVRGDFNDIIPEGIELGSFDIAYNSRIALAVKAQRTKGLLKVANLAAVIEPFAPGAGSRALNWPKAIRQASIDSSVMADVVNSEDTVDQLEEKDNKIAELMQTVELLQGAGQAASQFSAAGVEL